MPAHVGLRRHHYCQAATDHCHRQTCYLVRLYFQELHSVCKPSCEGGLGGSFLTTQEGLDAGMPSTNLRAAVQSRLRNPVITA